MNKLRPITIGTRKSKLAMTQTTYVADELKRHFPSLEITIKPIVTTGDVILDRPLSAIGSKGLFTEEIEREIKSGEIDMAVHSLKDMPSDLAPGLMIGAITARSARCDAFLSPRIVHWKMCHLTASSAHRACAVAPSFSPCVPI